MNDDEMGGAWFVLTVIFSALIAYVGKMAIVPSILFGGLVALGIVVVFFMLLGASASETKSSDDTKKSHEDSVEAFLRSRPENKDED